jgi:hypothetical protein
MACQDGVVVTAMNCYHAAQRKPEEFTPEEERKFLATNNLFLGAVISALHRSMRKTTYLAHQAKNYEMRLRQSLEFLMLAVSCTLWNSCMTTKWLKTVL